MHIVAQDKAMSWPFPIGRNSFEVNGVLLFTHHVFQQFNRCFLKISGIM